MAHQLGEGFGGGVDPRLLVLAREPADILVAEAGGGDFMARLGQRAYPHGIDFGDRGRNREGGDKAVPAQNVQNGVEPAMEREIRLWRGQVLGADALRAARDAEIDGDADAAAIAVRPAQIGIGNALLVGDRVVLLPGHRAQLLAGVVARTWRANSSQVGNHTPGSVFIRAISRSSIAIRSARPETNGCMTTFR